MLRPAVMLVRMTKHVMSRSKNNRLLNKCYKCNGEFCLDEIIVSRKAGCRTIYYHKTCAEMVNLWYPELEVTN